MRAAVGIGRIAAADDVFARREGSRSDANIGNRGGGIWQDAVVRQQREQSGHGAFARAAQRAFVRRALMVFARFGRAMHRTRCAVSRRHRAVGGSRRFVTALVRMRRRRLMSGAAITRHQRRHPSSLDDQPGGRPHAKVSTDCRHTSVQLSGAGSRPQSERRSRLVQGPEPHVPCQVQVAGINRFARKPCRSPDTAATLRVNGFRSGATLP